MWKTGAPTLDGVGRLEIFYNGAYGSVCTDGWTAASETVACRGMGYSGPAMLQRFVRSDGYAQQ